VQYDLEIVRRFIVPTKRARLRAFLETGHRDEVADSLRNPAIIDARIAVRIDDPDRFGNAWGHLEEFGLGGRVSSSAPTLNGMLSAFNLHICSSSALALASIRSGTVGRLAQDSTNGTIRAPGF
jgi:hypothetical protein